jgi:hypothetical protein
VILNTIYAERRLHAESTAHDNHQVTVKSLARPANRTAAAAGLHDPSFGREVLDRAVSREALASRTALFGLWS